MFAMLFGRFDPLGIAAGIALGPAAAIAMMYVYVHAVKKEKLFDYKIMNFE